MKTRYHCTIGINTVLKSKAFFMIHSPGYLLLKCIFYDTLSWLLTVEIKRFRTMTFAIFYVITFIHFTLKKYAKREL
jgi:hypothetical protein